MNMMPTTWCRRRFCALTASSATSRSARTLARGCTASRSTARSICCARGRADKHYGGDPQLAELAGAAAARSDAQQDRLLMSADLQKHVAAAMERLSSNERTAFVLRHFEGMPVEEIGKTLGIQVNAAKHTIFRAVRKLREALEPIVRSTPCNS